MNGIGIGLIVLIVLAAVIAFVVLSILADGMSR